MASKRRGGRASAKRQASARRAKSRRDARGATARGIAASGRNKKNKNRATGGTSTGRESGIAAANTYNRDKKEKSLQQSVGSLDRRVEKALADGNTALAKDLRSRQKNFVKDLAYERARKTPGGIMQGNVRTSDGRRPLTSAGFDVFQETIDQDFIDPTRKLQNRRDGNYKTMYPISAGIQKGLPSARILKKFFGQEEKDIPYNLDDMPGVRYPLDIGFGAGEEPFFGGRSLVDEDASLEEIINKYTRPKEVEEKEDFKIEIKPKPDAPNTKDGPDIKVKPKPDVPDEKVIENIKREAEMPEVLPYQAPFLINPDLLGVTTSDKLNMEDVVPSGAFADNLKEFEANEEKPQYFPSLANFGELAGAGLEGIGAVSGLNYFSPYTDMTDYVRNRAFVPQTKYTGEEFVEKMQADTNKAIEAIEAAQDLDANQKAELTDFVNSGGVNLTPVSLDGIQTNDPYNLISSSGFDNKGFDDYVLERLNKLR